MKIILTLITFISMNLYANENWIKIESINNSQTQKPNIRQDINLSQIEPINKMMQNATVIKQLIDTISKHEKQTTNDKNWFVLNSEVSK